MTSPELLVGGEITLRFRVTVAADFPASELEIANQASAWASGLQPVASDDPETPELGDSTRTPVYLTPVLSVSDAEATEGDATVVFTVSASRVSNRETTVGYATEDGSAVASLDYEATAGTLTIPAGESSAEVSVVLVDDALVETDETFDLVLSSPTNASSADARGVATVHDDDEETTDCLGPNLLLNGDAEAATTGCEVPGWSRVSGEPVGAASAHRAAARRGRELLRRSGRQRRRRGERPRVRRFM